MRDVFALKVISAVCGVLLVISVVGLILTIGTSTQSFGGTVRWSLAWIVSAVFWAGFGGWFWSQVVELTPIEQPTGHTFDAGDDGVDVEPPPRTQAPSPQPGHGPRAAYSFDPDD